MTSLIKYKNKPDSVKQIDNILTPIIKKWFYSKFESFSLPQLYGVREIHSRNNVLISAPTGATKTLTAFLSILNELIDSAQKNILQNKIYAVYVSPLKALNNDIKKNLIEPLEEINKIAGKDLGVRVGVRTGDTTVREKAKMLKSPPHIMITTPESLALMLSSPKFKENLAEVEWCIVDEIHALADNKRGVHLNLSLERLQRMSPGMCRVGLSATVAPLENVASFLAGVKRSCKIINTQFIKNMDLKVISPAEDLVNISYEELSKKMYELIDKLVQEHKTTLIFTNTRAGTERVVHNLKTNFPKNYYEIEEGPPSKVASLIGAHHGSLSKEHRELIENSLRKGKLKAVVCSTSLELGIDIGTIDLVILLGSPKSVARGLQRIGRSGHKLDARTKGRIIVLDRDDLVECSVLLKESIEKKIDRIHIPVNCLDVLTQQVLGMVLEQAWDVKELYDIIKKSYCYKDLSWKDYQEILSYLAGEFISLEERYVYAKIWYDREKNMVGKKGKKTRVIYMTNIGTIPDSVSVKVKIGQNILGTIDEAFLEKLNTGDRFVLGGNVYEFKHARGMSAQVFAASGKKPTVPSWFSESLPLSYDLANSIQKFRRIMKTKFEKKLSKKENIDFLLDYLYVDKVAAEAIYNYMKLQHDYVMIPNSKEILIEHYNDGEKPSIIFHTLYGRRVNDALSRVIAFSIYIEKHKEVDIAINDNGFLFTSSKDINVLEIIKKINSSNFENILLKAVEKSEVLRRRFRHCAGRSLMILRNYMGKKKNVGRQQVSSMLLLSTARRISDDFFILKEARREVVEDHMDIKSALEVIDKISNNEIRVKEVHNTVPTPFAFNLIAQGYSDSVRIQDRNEFLKKMHQYVLAKVSLK